MTEEERNEDLPVNVDEPRKRSELGEAWRDVGEQFQQLGAKLADALRRSWESTSHEPESAEEMRRLRDDLRAAADRIDTVARQVSSETAAERASTLKATREASQKSLDEARILTASTLRKLNKQLDHLAQRLERDESEAEEKEKTE